MSRMPGQEHTQGLTGRDLRVFNDGGFYRSVAKVPSAAVVIGISIFSFSAFAAVDGAQAGAVSSGKVWTEGWTGGLQASSGSVPISGEVAIAVAFGVAWAVFMFALLMLWIKVNNLKKEMDSLGAALAAGTGADAMPDDDNDDVLFKSDGDGSGRILVLEEIDI